MPMKKNRIIFLALIALIYTITALVIICRNEEKTATESEKGNTKRGITENDFIARIDNIALRPLYDEEKLNDSRFTQFADKQFPELGAKWGEVRKEHNRTLQIIHLLESKRADLLMIATWEGSGIDLHTGTPYLKLLNKLMYKCTLLKEQHEKLLPTMQRYYAENAVREIMGDSDIQENINDLLRTTDEILKISSEEM